MDYDEFEEVLKHHGVLGMKWGVRRNRSKGGSGGSKGQKKKKISKREAKKIAAEELKLSQKRAKSWRRKFNKREQLTNEELKRHIDRLKLENEFDRLSKEATKDISTVNKGKEVMKSLWNTKVPLEYEEQVGVPTKGRTVGQIVGDKAIDLAINQYLEKEKKPSSD